MTLKEMTKKKIIVYICAPVCTVVFTLCIVLSNLPSPVTSLHINSDTVRLESDMSKRLSITRNPEKGKTSGYELVSENEFVAVCDGNSVIAVNEGETFVYAKSLNGRIVSNKVKVIVSNDIFEVAAKIISLVEDNTLTLSSTDAVLEKAYSENKETGRKEEFDDTAITPEKVTDIKEETEQTIRLSTKAADPSAVVYVTASGGKYHSAGCTYAKNAVQVTIKEAISEGKTPCKRCNP